MSKYPDKLSDNDLEEYTSKTVYFLKNNQYYFEKGEHNAKNFVENFFTKKNPFTKLIIALLIISAVAFLSNFIPLFVFPSYTFDSARCIGLIIITFLGYFAIFYLPNFKELLAKEIYIMHIRDKIVEDYISKENMYSFKEAIETNESIDYESRRIIKDMIYYYEEKCKNETEAVESKLFFDDHFVRK